MPSGDPQPPSAATLRRLERASGGLATRAVSRMDEQLPWFRAMPADRRSWVMLVAQAGIASLVEWCRNPGRPPRLTGRPREHLEFTIWYLIQRELISRNDQSSLTITATGVDFVEANPHIRRQPLRIAGGNAK